jgi:hypothetical protein
MVIPGRNISLSVTNGHSRVVGHLYLFDFSSIQRVDVGKITRTKGRGVMLIDDNAVAYEYCA